MESDTRTSGERAIDRRLAQIRDRQDELSTMWNYVCSEDWAYRMVEIEAEALRHEKTKLLEVKADLD